MRPSRRTRAGGRGVCYGKDALCARQRPRAAPTEDRPLRQLRSRRRSSPCADRAGWADRRPRTHCDIVFATPASRQHCRIALDGHSVVVTDLGSTNGTSVAGRRIERPTRLHNGAHVAVGPYLLTYEQRDEREVEEEARLTGELREAVRYVRAILPEPIATGQVQTEWWYVPSSELGGDAFGYEFLTRRPLPAF